MEGSDGTVEAVAPPAKPLEALFDQEPEDDPFAQINGAEQPAPDIPALTGADEPSLPIKGEPDTPTDDVDAGERDFGDLLAEFEEDQAGETDLNVHAEVPGHEGGMLSDKVLDVPPVAPDPPAPIDAPAGLFDDAHDETFDILVAPVAEEEAQSQHVSSNDTSDIDPGVPAHSAPQELGAHENGAGDQSMQSSLADDSDWLADTSLEESFGGKPNEGPTTPPRSKTLPREPKRQETENGDDPVSFEVPQGWFDDAGNWNWYTDEQREQVRLAMTGEGGWEQDGNVDDAGYTAEPSPGLPHTPGLQIVSENAARRTPMKETNPYEQTLAVDPYAATSQPPTASTTGSYDSYQSGSRSSLGSESSPYAPAFNPASQYAPPSNQPSGYTPASNQLSQYAPVQPQNPYAPPTQPYAPAQAYPTSQPYGAQQTYTPMTNTIPPFGPPAGPSNISKPPPVAPQRIPSTAYDPPMLKQKKVTKSTSTMSFTPSGFNTPPTPSQATFGSPPAPAAPPTGPPRRAKTPKAEPPPTNQPSAPEDQMPRTFSPPSQIPAAQHSDPYAAGQGSMPPPPAPPQRPTSSQQSRIPRTPSYAAFDPPLRPASTSRQRDAPQHAIPASAPPPVASPPRMLSPPQAMPPPRSTSPREMMMPPPKVPTSQTTAPPTAQVLSPPQPTYEAPRTASRSSQRKSPMFQAKPTFEARPPSRTSVQSGPRFAPSPVAAPRETQAMAEYQRPSLESGGVPHQPTQPPPPPNQSHNDYQAPAYGLGLSTQDHAGGMNGHQLPERDNGQRVQEQSPESATYRSLAPRDDYNSDQYAQQAMSNGNNVGSGYDNLGYDTTRDRSGSIASNHQQAIARPQPDQSYDPRMSTDYSAPTSQPSYDPYAPTSQIPQNGQSRTNVDLDPYAPSSQMATSYQPYSGNDQSYAPTSYAPTSHLPQNGEGGYAPSSQQPQLTQAYAPSSYQPQHNDQTYAPSSYQPQNNDQTYAPSSYQPQSSDQTYAPASRAGQGPSPPPHKSFPSITSVQDHTYTPQQVLEQRPVSEDPLGRATLAARNAPIAVFGFGGRLITAFPGLAEDNAAEENDDGRTPAYGYASGRGKLWIRPVDDLGSSSALRTSDTPFPGPLVLDPSSARGAAGDKKKREAVLSYLEARAKEIEQGLPYLKTSASQSRREEEGKLALVRLLAAMIIGNGKLSGSPEAEDAVRTALAGSPESSPSQPLANLAANPLSPVKNAGTLGYFPGQSTQSAKASASQLSQLSAYLQRGERADAVQFAVNSGLWSHALLISSSVDAERWKEVVMAFLHAELGSSVVGNAAMRASYTLFAGLTPATVEDIVNIANITSDAAADQWQQVLSSIVFNGKPADLVCIDDLAAKLNASGLVNAAHACHLLSPASPFSDTTPAVFDRLIGLTQDPKDDDALVFAEVAEYARSLISVPKGQEATIPGLPQLLPYKLQRAWRLAELGDVDQAQRYCTAIEAASKPSKNGPSLLPFALLASLEDLIERLTGKPSASPANLLMPNRNKKTGVDKFGSWIEGRLTKFIAGEEDTPPSSHIKVSPAKAKLDPKDAQGPVGPFSHFSTISPAASGNVTRAPSALDFPAMNGLQDSAGTSPATLQGTWGQPLEPSVRDSTSSSLNYGAYEPHGGSASNPWSGSGQGDSPERPREDAEGELVNPMAYMNLGPSPEAARVNYTPQPVNLNEAGEDDDDLGFGNSSLSRARTPRPGDGSQDSKQASPNKAGPSVEETPKQETKPSLSKPDQKGSWIGRWWGKKEGEGSGPIRAKLGEESSMTFDPELKRWVVKGQKPDTAPPALAPPPRAQTVSPSMAGDHAPGPARASSVAPASNPGMSAPPTGMPPPARSLPRSTTAPMGFTQLADGSVKRAKPPLESLTGDAPPPLPSASLSSTSSKSSSSSLAPPPPGLPRSATTGASLDDLLSRPPSKRPSSAARKPMKNRYVDVFQPGQQQ